MDNPFIGAHDMCTNSKTILDLAGSSGNHRRLLGFYVLVSRGGIRATKTSSAQPNIFGSNFIFIFKRLLNIQIINLEHNHLK